MHENYSAFSTLNVEAAFSPTMEGFGRTELSVRNLKLLSTPAGLVEGVARQYKLDGQELDQAGVTYVLQKADSGWKIAVIVIYDAKER